MTFVTTLWQRRTNVERANCNLILLKETAMFTTIDLNSYPELKYYYGSNLSYVSFFGDVLKFFRKRMDLKLFRGICGF